MLFVTSWQCALCSIWLAPLVCLYILTDLVCLLSVCALFSPCLLIITTTCLSPHISPAPFLHHYLIPFLAVFSSSTSTFWGQHWCSFNGFMCNVPILSNGLCKNFIRDIYYTSKYNQPGCCSSAVKRVKRQIHSLTSHLNDTTCKCQMWRFRLLRCNHPAGIFQYYSEWNLLRNKVQQIKKTVKSCSAGKTPSQWKKKATYSRQQGCHKYTKRLSTTVVWRRAFVKAQAIHQTTN